MPPQNEHTSLAQFNEGVGKFLIVLGLLFIAGFFFKAGEKAYFPRLWHAFHDFVESFKGSEPGHIEVPGGEHILPGHSPSQYSIVVGEYNDIGEAIAMQKRLKKRRINSNIHPMGRNYLLLVGPLSSYNQLRYSLKVLHKNGFPGKPYTEY